MTSDCKDTDGKSAADLAPAMRSTATRLTIPVTVILERRLVSRSFWSLPSWYLHTVAVGENVSLGQDSTRRSALAIGTSDKGELFAWSGFDVTLYKDACERYWHALIGDKPLVYVIGREASDDDGETSDAQMQVVSVSVDYDAANAAAETDVPVFSAPIPAELYKYMEQFVLTHYRPQAFTKRKRRNWSGDDTGKSVQGATGPDSRGRGQERRDERSRELRGEHSRGRRDE